MKEREPAVVPAVLVRGARGAVSSPHALASQAGIGMLRAGGSAVDAAIATNAALAVVSCFMCGLGGDAFWLIWDVEAGAARALNGSGRSASRATVEAASDAGLKAMPLRGAWTITVPGAIDSWHEAHQRYGRMPWTVLFEPAIELATDGFPASETWLRAIASGTRAFGDGSDWARTFRAGGREVRLGDRVTLPSLGRTLKRIAEEGAATAYTGAVARQAADYLESRGSPLRADDFAAHRSDWLEPITTDYRGVTSVSHPPNSSGPLALLTLNMLSISDPPPAGAFDGRGVDDVDWVHLGLEASRLVLAERDAKLTDLDAMEDGALAGLLSRELAAELVGRIDRRRATPPILTTLPRGGGTIYLATADRWGGAVSLIQSNYAGFGSGLVDPQTGIGYQNRGAFFRLDPSHPNALAPRKRTVHTLTPGMLLRDGRPWIVHGSMGGEIQPQVFGQFVSAVVDGGLDVGTAVAAPRWAADVEEHLGPPSLTVLESRYHPSVIEGLRARGHDIRIDEPWSSGMGHEHAIELVRGPGRERDADTDTDADGDGDTLTIAATADPRSEGLPAVW
ncbi:MAG: gamma-glutamyltranspeptidase / glutathione hydrolase [Chloroflexota bacterium]|jgi:gamma-glutamyltranspeptidase/glutathione hydrolase|nr:gamma-glutamyltranspeptidase / glutathione hydrolase [Chloroflexota bacterium]